MITVPILQVLSPTTKNTILEQYIGPLNDVLPYYDIDTKERAAAFLAQIIHESSGFTRIKENLNYSAAGLIGTFHKQFPTMEIAEQYAHQSEKIANRAYANKLDNGDEASGDGFKFRGRGLIQLTGRANYDKFAGGLGMEIDDCIAYLETPAGATSSAGWFWDDRSLNGYCDRNDFVGLTKRINAALLGLAERQKLYAKALPLL